MRELSLHILDLIENALRAGAGVVAVEVQEDRECNLLRLTVEDDGPGLTIDPARATDPFCTTRAAKSREPVKDRGREDIGLGLSLLRFRCEQAAGELALGRSPLGGLAVMATFGLSHVDRSPLGDLAATLSGVMATNPALDLRLRLRCGAREWRLSSLEAARVLAAPRPGRAAGTVTATVGANPLALAKRVREQITEGLRALQMKE